MKSLMREVSFSLLDLYCFNVKLYANCLIIIMHCTMYQSGNSRGSGFMHSYKCTGELTCVCKTGELAFGSTTMSCELCYISLCYAF